jgi:hypothetical protein
MCIPSHLHSTKLQPCPSIKLGRSYKWHMDTEGTVHSWTVHAQEHSIGHTGPCRICLWTVKALLKKKNRQIKYMCVCTLIIIIIIMSNIEFLTSPSTDRCWSATPQMPCWISRFWVHFSWKPTVMSSDAVARHSTALQQGQKNFCRRSWFWSF